MIRTRNRIKLLIFVWAIFAKFAVNGVELSGDGVWELRARANHLERANSHSMIGDDREEQRKTAAKISDPKRFRGNVGSADCALGELRAQKVDVRPREQLISPKQRLVSRKQKKAEKPKERK